MDDEENMRELAASELWSSPASDVIHINLISTRGDKLFEDDFRPEYTYAIFGEDEVIPGYKDLSIRINFRANDMKPTVKTEYAQKMKPINEQMAELMDIEKQLADFLPESAFNAMAGASNGVDKQNLPWTPPGKVSHEYEVDGKKFQIWTAPLLDPRASEIIRNMRILIPFLIDGGTVGFLDDSEWSLERWKVFFLYEVSPESAYTLAGFSTSYRLWVFPSNDVERMAKISESYPTPPPFDSAQETMPTSVSPLDLLSRERISQFIILPYYQGASHGSHLYNAMLSLFRADPHVFEVTVEEPNENFDVLRDLNDYAYLLSQHPSFASLSLPSTVPAEQLTPQSFVPDLLDQEALFRVRSLAKLAPRQFQRLAEIHALSLIPPYHRNLARLTRKSAAPDERDRKYYFWRLMVKERLFLRNKDQLLQVDEGERVERLEQTMPDLVAEYEERLGQFERRTEAGLMQLVETFSGAAKAAAREGEGRAKAGPSAARKRKVVDDDEELEELGSPAPKRAG